jgi:hypothetical protein
MSNRPRQFVTACQRFGRLVVLDPEIRTGPQNGRGARLRCDCGTADYETPLYPLLAGTVRSCGCLNREQLSAGLSRTHGLSKHPLYGTWTGMMTRCYRPGHVKYAYYGGKGISEGQAGTFNGPCALNVIAAPVLDTLPVAVNVHVVLPLASGALPLAMIW